MFKLKAKIRFKHNSYEILNEGDHVICAVSNKQIGLKELNYWNVDLQEAYFSPREVQIRQAQIKNNK
tara:strand:- start:676 stop:876 length:201 start_codon:yes stop_codon:yes gene_type:complete